MMVAKHNTGHLVVLAAGGTGGHVFPAESLAQELLAQGHRLVLITDRRGATHGGTLGLIETIRINAGPLAGKSLVSRVRALVDLARGFFEARRVLVGLRPSVVAGFGGYAAAPTMLAAINLGLPTIVHEQNAILGSANRLLVRHVDRVCTSFDLAKPIATSAQIIHTGLPLRPAVLAQRGIPYQGPTADGPFRILVLGGSQGAKIFSDVVPAAIQMLPESLRKRLEISQQCRAEELDRTHAAYADSGAQVQLRHFFDNAPELLAKSHLLIARSGAGTVTEASVIGRPSLLIPLPRADGDQLYNAEALARAGGGWVMPQPQFTPAALAARLTQFADTPELLSDAAAAAAAFSIPDAASRLASVVTALIRGENGARNGNGNHVAPALHPTVKPGAV